MPTGDDNSSKSLISQYVLEKRECLKRKEALADQAFREGNFAQHRYYMVIVKQLQRDIKHFNNAHDGNPT